MNKGDNKKVHYLEPLHYLLLLEEQGCVVGNGTNEDDEIMCEMNLNEMLGGDYMGCFGSDSGDEKAGKLMVIEKGR